MFVERMTQRVKDGKWRELKELEKRYDTLEEQLGGFPPKRRYWSDFGGLDWGTFVWEREWESLAAMEAAEAKYWADPELAETMRKLGSEGREIFGSVKHELYRLWSEDTQE